MVTAKKGDVVILEYTGRFSESGSVFDTTDEQAAKAAGIFDLNAKYGPKTAVFGTKTIIQGIEDAILASERGKEREFSILPEKAFGEKMPDLIRMLPEKEFRLQGIIPEPGMVVALDRSFARVKSVTSGRVVVDFNHPLAGEKVTYKIKVIDVIADDQKKIEAVLSSFSLKGIVEKDGGKYKVTVEKGANKDSVEAARQTISTILAQAEVKEG